MRCMMVGFSKVAQTDHFPVYVNRGVEIAAVVDICPARLLKAQTLLPGCRVYNSLDQALALEKVDFCDVAVPPYRHADSVLKCLRNRLPVICEKPLVVEQEELIEILRAIETYGVMLFPCHTWQYSAQMRDVKNIMAQEGIGNPLRLEVKILRTGASLGTPEWKPRWRTCLEIAGGGIFMDHGYHMLYLAQNLLQARPCGLQVLDAQRDPSGLELDLALQFEFAPFAAPDARLTARAHLTWLAEERVTSYHLFGSQGFILIENEKTTWKNVTQQERIAADGGLTSSSEHPLWFDQLFQHFLECLHQGNLFHEELLKACFTMQAIWASYASGEDKKYQLINTTKWASFFNASPRPC